LPDAEHVGPEGGLSGSRRKAESLSDILKRVVTEHVRGELPDNPTVSARGLRLVGRYGAPTSRAASVSTHTRERCSAATSEPR